MVHLIEDIYLRSPEAQFEHYVEVTPAEDVCFQNEDRMRLKDRVQRWTVFSMLLCAILISILAFAFFHSDSGLLSINNDPDVNEDPPHRLGNPGAITRATSTMCGAYMHFPGADYETFTVCPFLSTESQTLACARGDRLIILEVNLKGASQSEALGRLYNFCSGNLPGGVCTFTFFNDIDERGSPATTVDPAIITEEEVEGAAPVPTVNPYWIDLEYMCIFQKNHVTSYGDNTNTKVQDHPPSPKTPYVDQTSIPKRPIWPSNGPPKNVNGKGFGANSDPYFGYYDIGMNHNIKVTLPPQAPQKVPGFTNGNNGYFYPPVVNSQKNPGRQNGAPLSTVINANKPGEFIRRRLTGEEPIEKTVEQNNIVLGEPKYDGFHGAHHSEPVISEPVIQPPCHQGYGGFHGCDSYADAPILGKTTGSPTFAPTEMPSIATGAEVEEIEAGAEVEGIVTTANPTGGAQPNPPRGGTYLRGTTNIDVCDAFFQYPQTDYRRFETCSFSADKTMTLQCDAHEALYILDITTTSPHAVHNKVSKMYKVCKPQITVRNPACSFTWNVDMLEAEPTTAGTAGAEAEPITGEFSVSYICDRV